MMVRLEILLLGNLLLFHVHLVGVQPNVRASSQAEPKLEFETRVSSLLIRAFAIIVIRYLSENAL